MKLTALALVGVMLFSGPLACERQRPERKVPSDRNPADRVVDPKLKRTVTIRVRVEDAYAPYDVTVKVTGPDGHEKSGPEPVTHGPYDQTIDYSTGVLLVVDVRVNLVRSIPLSVQHATDRNYCEIDDGPLNKIKKGFVDRVCQVVGHTVR